MALARDGIVVCNCSFNYDDISVVLIVIYLGFVITFIHTWI